MYRNKLLSLSVADAVDLPWRSSNEHPAALERVFENEQLEGKLLKFDVTFKTPKEVGSSLTISCYCKSGSLPTQSFCHSVIIFGLSVLARQAL